MKYYFPAIFRRLDDDGVEKFAVTAPDFPYFDAIGFDLPDTYASVKHLLSSRICVMEDQNTPVPLATDILTISPAPGEFVAIVEADTDVYRAQRELERVNTNVTIPAYLKELAVDNKINFSQTLEEALKVKLGITGPSLSQTIREFSNFTRQTRQGKCAMATQRIEDIMDLETIEKVELWKSLHIPAELIMRELPSLQSLIDGPFPFFLRFEDDSVIRCITATDYPEKGKALSVHKRVSMPPSAGHTEDITLTPEFALQKLNEGYKWCRVREYDTMW